MGEFYYSMVKSKVKPEQVQADLEVLSKKLWATFYRIERIPGVPNGPADDRLAKWAFWLTDTPSPDCMFTVALLRGGQSFEFKVPRTSWDRWWEDQQKIRRRLVRLYNRKV